MLSEALVLTEYRQPPAERFVWTEAKKFAYLNRVQLLSGKSAFVATGRGVFDEAKRQFNKHLLPKGNTPLRTNPRPTVMKWIQARKKAVGPGKNPVRGGSYTLLDELTPVIERWERVARERKAKEERKKADLQLKNDRAADAARDLSAALRNLSNISQVLIKDGYKELARTSEWVDIHPDSFSGPRVIPDHPTPDSPEIVEKDSSGGEGKNRATLGEPEIGQNHDKTYEAAIAIVLDVKKQLNEIQSKMMKIC